MRKIVLVLAAAFAATLSGVGLDQKDVEYARPGGTPLLLDLHVPDGAGPFPTAILIHGGGFDEGSRSTNVKPLFDVLSDAGFAWFTIDYRLAPAAHFPEAIDDVYTAIRWVKAHAADYHVDVHKIAIIGESAGGLLVNYAGTHELEDAKIAAVVDFYGPVDYAKLAQARLDHPELFNMTSINRHAANGGGIHFFGASQLDEAGRAKLWSLAPIAAVHKGMPPFLCIHGDQDDQVLYEQSIAMSDAMHKVGASCELITIAGGGHGMSGWKAPEMQHWKPEMVAWLKKTLMVMSAEEQPILDGLRGLRKVPDDARGGVTRDLALRIRRLPVDPNKLLLANALANLSTEGDFGQDTLQVVATTLADALREQPSAGDGYLTLAQLIRYEHVRVSFDAPPFAAAMTKLRSDDEKRASADVDLRDLSGREWRLSSLRGKVVLVNFWATWCPPCRKEIPDLGALYERFKDKGFVILGISDEEAAKVAPFVKERNVPYPILLDPGDKVSDLFAVEGIPKSFVFDRDGKLVATAIDMRTAPQFLAMLAKAGLN